MIITLALVASLSQATPPAEVRCEYKHMLNLPDLLKASLTRTAAGTYDFVIDDTMKVETRKNLSCQFHKTEPGVFACKDAKGGWGAFANRLREQTIDVEGNEKAFDGYFIELVRNPLGEAKTVRDIRVPADTCKLK